MKTRTKKVLLIKICDLLLLILLAGKASVQGFRIRETSQDDVDAIYDMLHQYAPLSSGDLIVGDPCDHEFGGGLPWVKCDDSDPVRVIALKLSSHSLEGPLTNFSKMQALETIDLSKNRLNGSIPDFLGELPKLKRLDLHDNQFSGVIPDSIIENEKLKYNVEGNPGLLIPKKKKNLNLGLIIGLPVGLVLGIGLPCLIILIKARISRKKQQTLQQQVAEVDQSSLNIGIRNAQQAQPPHQELNKQYHPPSAQSFDQNELNELLQLHNSKQSA